MMVHHFAARRLSLISLALILSALPLAGCVIVATNSEGPIGTKGGIMPEETLARIEPGQTTRSQVLALLGEPSSKSDEKGLTQWQWDYVSPVQKQSCICLFKCRSTVEQQVQYRVFITLDGDVVQKKWTDTNETKDE